MTIWIISSSILALSETVHSNLHTLQLTQPNQSQLIHIHKTLITNHNLLQSLESSQIQYIERSVIQIIGYNELGNPRTKSIPLIHSGYGNNSIRLLDEIGMIRQSANIYRSLTTHTLTICTQFIITPERVWKSHVHKKWHVYSSFQYNKNHLRVQCCVGS